jgi:hypothetical protein
MQDLAGSIVLTFNGMKFDNAVVMNDNNIGGGTPWNDVDLLFRVVRAKFKVETVKEAEEKYGAEVVHDGSIGLNGLSIGTLGMQKTSHGSKSPKMIQAGRWAEVFAYNLHDVRLTWKLYEYSRMYGRLIDGSGQLIVMSDVERL